MLFAFVTMRFARRRGSGTAATAGAEGGQNQRQLLAPLSGLSGVETSGLDEPETRQNTQIARTSGTRAFSRGTNGGSGNAPFDPRQLRRKDNTDN